MLRPVITYYSERALDEDPQAVRDERGRLRVSDDEGRYGWAEIASVVWDDEKTVPGAARQLIDLDYWCFREKATDEDDEDRLRIPHSDRSRYENPVDLMFVSREAAVRWRDESVEEEQTCILTDANMATEDDCTTHAHEPLEASGWVLVHYVGTAEYPPSCDVVEGCPNPSVDCIGGEMIWYCSVHAVGAPDVYGAWQCDPERAARAAQ